MSGGVAYVLDEGGGFARVCNPEMVSLSPLDDPGEASKVREMIARHVKVTGSRRGQLVLDAWPEMQARFVRVVPNDYRRVLEAQEAMRARGLSPAEAEMAAFEENARDAARAGGN
jgi:glutamate synthase (ferredoxin)